MLRHSDVGSKPQMLRAAGGIRLNDEVRLTHHARAVRFRGELAYKLGLKKYYANKRFHESQWGIIFRVQRIVHVRAAIFVSIIDTKCGRQYIVNPDSVELYNSSETVKQWCSRVASMQTLPKGVDVECRDGVHVFNLKNHKTEEEVTMLDPNKILFERKTFIQGNEANKYSDDQLIEIIQDVECKIKDLDSIESESKTLGQKIAKLKEQLKEVVAELDSPGRGN